MEEKIYVTEEGLKDLQDEYDKLVHVVRDEVKEELRAARAQGDLSENADYDAARDRQARVEARIADLEIMLKPENYVIIDTSKGSSKVVRIGSTVTLQFIELNETKTYSIVGTTEADPLNGKLSNATPLALAIIDKKVGSTIAVTDVVKPYKVKILAVE